MLFHKIVVGQKNNNTKKVYCWGSGNPKREFLHVNDLGDACLFLLKKWDPSSSLAPKDSLGKNLFHLNYYNLD